MQTMTFAGKTYSLDDSGFLDPPEQWDEDFAKGMAGSLGMEGSLDARHWSVIDYLRRKVLKEKTLPYFVTACMDNGLRLHSGPCFRRATTGGRAESRASAMPPR